jgi:hypothetical protein
VLSGLGVTTTVRKYPPATILVVQVARDEEIGPFLAAGAAEVDRRRVPAAEIAARLLGLLAVGVPPSAVRGMTAGRQA